MSVVIGIDVGGSTTKIVGFTKDKKLIEPLFVSAADPLTSVYGALGTFTQKNALSLSDIDRVMITGVGSYAVGNELHGLPCEIVPEFRCIGLGGLYLSGLDRAVVVSLGTGTALVHAKRGEEPVYLGGTGVGGGTLVGLSRKLLGFETIRHIDEAASNGDLSMIDLCVNDISKKEVGGLAGTLTASNFGKISDGATSDDVALGLVNMVYETIGMVAMFAARGQNTRDIVLTGNLTSLSQCRPIFEKLNVLFDLNFVIPDHARFGTVIGAALCAFEDADTL